MRDRASLTSLDTTRASRRKAQQKHRWPTLVTGRQSPEPACALRSMRAHRLLRDRASSPRDVRVASIAHSASFATATNPPVRSLDGVRRGSIACASARAAARAAHGTAPVVPRMRRRCGSRTDSARMRDRGTCAVSQRMHAAGPARPMQECDAAGARVVSLLNARPRGRLCSRDAGGPAWCPRDVSEARP